MMKLGCSMILGLALVGDAAQGAENSSGLGELMMGIQQHHAKLYYAGQAQNWELASYELDEIKESFADAGKAQHEFKTLKTPLKELIPAMTKNEIEKVEEAIAKKNKESFVKSFQGLTQACNRCHQTAEHSFIVIQSPTQPGFTNQKFTK